MYVTYFVYVLHDVDQTGVQVTGIQTRPPEVPSAAHLRLLDPTLIGLADAPPATNVTPAETATAVWVLATAPGAGATTISASLNRETGFRIYEAKTVDQLLALPARAEPYRCDNQSLQALGPGIAVIVTAGEEVLRAAATAYQMQAAGPSPVVVLNNPMPVRITRQHESVLRSLRGSRIPAYKIPYSGRSWRTHGAVSVPLPPAMKEILHGLAHGLVK